MRRDALAALAAALLVGARSLAAQGVCDVATASGSCVTYDYAAYVAMMGTPAGAVAPVLNAAMLELPGHAPAIGLRYGSLGTDGGTSHNFAADLVLPVGPGGSVDLSAGYVSPDCNGCEGFPMIGAGLDGRLVSSPLGRDPEAATLTMGIGWQLGYAKPSGGHYLSVLGSLPVALVMSAGSVKIAPFLQPALGYGRVGGAGFSDSGTRPLLGGGVALANRAATISLDMGFQHVFIHDGRTTVGIGLVIGTGS